MVKKTKRSKTKDRGGEYIKRCETMPPEAMERLLRILKTSKVSYYRENLGEKLILVNPYWAKFFFVKKIPLGTIVNTKILNTIKDSMTMKKKKEIYQKSLTYVDKNHKIFEPNKITGITRRINRRKDGDRITSNTEDGLRYLKNAPLKTIAKKLYNMLNWNSGQLSTWHDHMERFTEECKDKVFVKDLVSHSNCAYDQVKLPNLTEIMAKHAGVVPV